MCCTRFVGSIMTITYAPFCLQASKDGKSLVVSLKTRQAATHPAKGERQVTLQQRYKGASRTIKSVKALAASARPAHQRVLAKRASQLVRTSKPVKAAKGSRRVKAAE